MVATIPERGKEGLAAWNTQQNEQQSARADTGKRHCSAKRDDCGFSFPPVQYPHCVAHLSTMLC